MNGTHQADRVVGRVDVDQVGDRLELYLLGEDVEGARMFQDQIQDSMRWLRHALEQIGCELLYSGCDDVLFQIQAGGYQHSAVEQLREQFSRRTGCTLSYGFGGTISEALRNLRVAKLSGRNRAVGRLPTLSGDRGGAIPLQSDQHGTLPVARMLS